MSVTFSHWKLIIEFNSLLQRNRNIPLAIITMAVKHNTNMQDITETLLNMLSELTTEANISEKGIE